MLKGLRNLDRGIVVIYGLEFAHRFPQPHLDAVTCLIELRIDCYDALVPQKSNLILYHL